MDKSASDYRYFRFRDYGERSTAILLPVRLDSCLALIISELNASNSIKIGSLLLEIRLEVSDGNMLTSWRMIRFAVTLHKLGLISINGPYVKNID
jgi:hypothetical protein